MAPRTVKRTPQAVPEVLSLMCEDDEFLTSRSRDVLLHWVRALLYMYFLSFKYLDRLAMEDHARLLKGAGMNARYGECKFTADLVPALKRCMWDFMQHMMHAWHTLGKCMETRLWRDDAAASCHQVVRKAKCIHLPQWPVPQCFPADCVLPSFPFM